MDYFTNKYDLLNCFENLDEYRHFLEAYIQTKENLTCHCIACNEFRSMNISKDIVSTSPVPSSHLP